MLRPCLLSSIMTCFEISAISGMVCIAWRSDADASAKAPELSWRAPKLLSRLRSSGLGVAEESSGRMFLSAFFNRGRAWSDQGQHDKAIRDFDEAIRIDPRYPEAFNNRGIALGGKGQRDRAIQDFDEAIRIDPNYAIALHNRALALRALGRMVEADADVARARQAGPRLTTTKE